jgi:hypothetical protein
MSGVSDKWDGPEFLPLAVNAALEDNGSPTPVIETGPTISMISFIRDACAS